MRQAFKYRLFTNANQERELGTMLETHRRLWNQCLNRRKAAYETEKKNITSVDLSRWFKTERTTNQFYARLNFSSAQRTMRRLDKAFDSFFRRIKSGDKPGYPRFKMRNHFNSITFINADGMRLIGNRLRVQHVGMIRVKLHRPIEGTIKTVALKREADKWFVIFSCDMGDAKLEPDTLPSVGIDVGLTHFLTTSNGDHEPNPRYLKDALPKLRVAGRAVARKKKAGKNRRKATHKLAKIHARVRNLRREHHHQIALRLVRRFGTIAVERLNVQGMLGSPRLARSIADAGWSGFLATLRHKAEKAGVVVVEVDPRGTSQECSCCEREVPKDLSVRWHDCPHCGLSIDRDHNAALNILARGLVRIAPAEVNVGQQTERTPRSQSRKTTV